MDLDAYFEKEALERLVKFAPIKPETEVERLLREQRQEEFAIALEAAKAANIDEDEDESNDE